LGQGNLGGCFGYPGGGGLVFSHRLVEIGLSGRHPTTDAAGLGTGRLDLRLDLGELTLDFLELRSFVCGQRHRQSQGYQESQSQPR
jgi:hypothetical protein